jgi:hypothetical protein
VKPHDREVSPGFRVHEVTDTELLAASPTYRAIRGLRDCWHCGEVIAADDPAAEIYEVNGPTESRVVHAEPCGTDLLASGWEIA